MYVLANVSGMVMSHASGLPLIHGICVAPSGICLIIIIFIIIIINTATTATINNNIFVCTLGSKDSED